MSLTGSYGLAVDLGLPSTSGEVKAIYEFIWNLPEITGPESTLNEFMGFPRGAMGHLTIENAGQGACYTRFERDSLGYPPDWEVPTLLTFSLYDFAINLPNNTELYHFLVRICHQLNQIYPFRMAIIGDLTLYYLNADFMNTAWLDWQHQGLQAVFLPTIHPFTKQHPAPFSQNQLHHYNSDDLKQFVSDKPEKEKYLDYKTRISMEMHSKIPITFESDSELDSL